MHQNPYAVVQVNGKRSEAFVIECLVRQSCSLSPLLYVLALEPLLSRLRDEKASPSLRGIPLTGPLLVKVSTFADDISVFVTCRLDIKAVKKAVTRYEETAGVKINFDGSEGLRLGAWRDGVPLPVPFCWSDGSVRILEVWFGPGLQLRRNWSEVQVQVDVQVGTRLRRWLPLKSRVEVCIVYIVPLILYCLSVLPLPKNRRLALQWSLSKLLWGGRRPMVRRHVCCQRPRNGGLSMSDLENHWFVERLAHSVRSLSKDTVWRRKASNTFPHLKPDPKVEGQRRWKSEAPFALECHKAFRNLPGSSDFSRPRKKLYRDFVVGSALGPFVDRFGWSIEEVRLHWNWAPGSGFLKNSEFYSPGGLHGTRCPFSAWITKQASQTCLIVLAVAEV